MVALIAWKNIWRNKLRSLVVMVSIVLGIWAGTFILAFVFGMIEQRLDDAIGYEISHLQVHHPEFQKDKEAKFVISNTDKIINDLEATGEVEALSGRVLAFGMVTAPTTSSSGKFIGIDPIMEDSLTQLSGLIVEGEYLQPGDKNKVIIGQKLVDKLKLKIRNKIVLTFQDKDRNIVSGAFRIKGIFKHFNTSLEEFNLYVPKSDLERHMNINNESHEIAVLLKQSDQVDNFISNNEKRYEKLDFESWKELAPELALMIESLDQYMLIFLIIILLALSFSIVNTMLMAVLERVREIGVLMAIGMNKWRLFSMISLETIYIIGLAAPIGLLLAYSTISYLETNGLDVSGLYNEGYAAFGFHSFVYPHLEAYYYFRILGMVAITALLASIYPAYTALKLDPVKAIRKI